MSAQRNFSLPEANALLPKIKTMLATANKELAAKSQVLTIAFASYEKCEQAMNEVKPVQSSGTDADNALNNGFASLRQCRLDFQAAIESLSQAKQSYIQAINFWFEEITDTGVILRDIKTGLLDFPARSDSFEYYLCWQLADSEISHWHTTNEGFTGRRPLAVLKEYV